MSDGISEARGRQLRCRKWISILEQWCSHTPATEAVLPSIHYARPVISCSGATLHRYHQALFKKDMQHRGERFFEKTSGQTPPLGAHKKATRLGFAMRLY